VDVTPGKEELARAAGATEFVVSGEDTAKRSVSSPGGTERTPPSSAWAGPTPSGPPGRPRAEVAVRQWSASAAGTRR
jgi:hypothetical protein